ncbi:MAG: hypothetical protein V5A33_00545 [Halobacteriales archaeon]
MTVRGLLDGADAMVRDYSHLRGVVLRGGLGVAILLAGAHKLVAPGAWHVYLAPPFADLWPTAVLPFDPTFVLFGVSEVLFGLLLLADWHRRDADSAVPGGCRGEPLCGRRGRGAVRGRSDSRPGVGAPRVRGRAGGGGARIGEDGGT